MEGSIVDLRLGKKAFFKRTGEEWSRNGFEE